MADIHRPRNEPKSYLCGQTWKTARRRFFFILAALFLVSGFLYQTGHLTEEFLKFKVDTKISYDSKDLSRYLDLYTCIPYFRIFNTEEFFKETGVRINIDFTSLAASWKSAKKLIDIATLDQIMRLTPQLKYTMEGCVLRQRNKGESYKDVNVDEVKICKEEIKIRKEIFDNRICYVSTFRQTVIDVVADSVIYDPIDPLVVKSIKFNITLFEKAGFMTTFFASYGIDSIHREYKLAPRIDLGYDPSNKTRHFKRVGVQYYQESIQRLEPPYATNCSPGFHREKNMSKCIEEEVWNRYGRLSTMTLYRENTGKEHERFLSEQSLNMSDSSVGWNEIGMRCNEKIKSLQECRYDVIHSEIGEVYDWNHFEVFMMPPKHKSSNVTTEEKYSTYSFVTDISSNVGTWFGVSFVVILAVFGLYWGRGTKSNQVADESVLELSGITQWSPKKQALRIKDAIASLWKELRIVKGMATKSSEDIEQGQFLLGDLEERLTAAMAQMAAERDRMDVERNKMAAEQNRISAKQKRTEQELKNRIELIEASESSSNDRVLRLDEEMKAVVSRLNVLSEGQQSAAECLIQIGDQQQEIEESVLEAFATAKEERIGLNQRLTNVEQETSKVSKKVNEELQDVCTKLRHVTVTMDRIEVHQDHIDHQVNRINATVDTLNGRSDNIGQPNLAAQQEALQNGQAGQQEDLDNLGRRMYRVETSVDCHKKSIDDTHDQQVAFLQDMVRLENRQRSIERLVDQLRSSGSGHDYTAFTGSSGSSSVAHDCIIDEQWKKTAEEHIVAMGQWVKTFDERLAAINAMITANKSEPAESDDAMKLIKQTVMKQNLAINELEKLVKKQATILSLKLKPVVSSDSSVDQGSSDHGQGDQSGDSTPSESNPGAVDGDPLPQPSTSTAVRTLRPLKRIMNRPRNQ